jgi:hypothetical protein
MVVWYQIGTIVFFMGLISFLIVKALKLNKKDE